MSNRREKNKSRQHLKKSANTPPTLLERPRIIYNGEDRTPESLLNLHQKATNTNLSKISSFVDSSNNGGQKPWSIEDMGFLKLGTKEALSIPSSFKEYPSIPWLDGSMENDLVVHDWEPLKEHQTLFEYAHLMTDGITNPSYASSMQKEKLPKTTIINEHQHKKIHKRLKKIEGDVAMISEPKFEYYCDIDLKESSTFFLLNLRSQGLYSPDEVINASNTVNNISESRCRKMLMDREAQTSYKSYRTKAILTNQIQMEDKECMNSPGHSSGSYDVKGENKNDKNDLVESLTAAVANCEGFLLDVSEGMHARAKKTNLKYISSDEMENINSLQDIKKVWKRNEIMNSSNFAKSLKIIERALQQTFHHKLQLRYRGLPKSHNKVRINVLPTSSKQLSWTKSFVSIDKQPLKRLFHLHCHLTKGRLVNCLCWHKVNKDVLVAGYGPPEETHDTNRNDNGLISFWSLRNLVHPEKILKVSSGVTAIDYSRCRPSILAVGMTSGNIAIFDTSAKSADSHKPIIESEFIHGRHRVLVSQLRWINKDSEKDERLISIALDGKILEWQIQKGLVFKSLMVLKHIGENSSVISRYGAGLCFDFPSNDPHVYLAGSDNGYVYRCSCSHKDQHLDAFQAHDGPVTKIVSSPFIPGIYLTSSTDWHVKLWKISSNAAGTSSENKLIAEFHSMNLFDSVHDVVWSSKVSTMFALVTGDGRVEVWDLSESFLDPILTDLGTDKGDKLERLSSMFSHPDSESHLLVTGTNDGFVEIFDVNEHYRDSFSEKGAYTKRREQVEKLQSAIASIARDGNP